MSRNTNVVTHSWSNWSSVTSAAELRAVVFPGGHRVRCALPFVQQLQV